MNRREVENLERAERGVVRPERLPAAFRRIAPTGAAAGYVRWWWYSEWDLPLGHTSDQEILAFPSFNVVIEPGRAGISGPTSTMATKSLSGTGWAVAALLQPGVVPHLINSPAEAIDRYLVIDEPHLVKAVTAARNHAPLEAWLSARVGALSSEAENANQILHLAESDPDVHSVEQWAWAANVSRRSLHRLTRKYIGLTPAAVIRRRRIQDACFLLRSEVDLPIAEIAIRCGFTDHAHFTNEFRQTCLVTPSGYRRSRS
ncbi:helix-turn-helix transcriptional regulator [Corynebacterium qintianiae]|uniref:helix-turn-helix transcriptional regulator n=1 Tax=Corynebacterium qintianiae TaxID=2709392 RepID=UPI0013EB624B